MILSLDMDAFAVQLLKGYTRLDAAVSDMV